MTVMCVDRFGIPDWSAEFEQLCASKKPYSGNGWSLPDGRGGFKKKLFIANTSSSLSDWIMGILGEAGACWRDVASASPLDPEAQFIGLTFVEAGFGDIRVNAPGSAYVRKERR